MISPGGWFRPHVVKGAHGIRPLKEESFHVPAQDVRGDTYMPDDRPEIVAPTRLVEVAHALRDLLLTLGAFPA